MAQGLRACTWAELWENSLQTSQYISFCLKVIPSNSRGGNKLSSLKSPVKGMKIERTEGEERGRQCWCCQEIRMGRTTLTKGRNWRQTLRGTTTVTTHKPRGTKEAISPIVEETFLQAVWSATSAFHFSLYVRAWMAPTWRQIEGENSNSQVKAAKSPP